MKAQTARLGEFFAKCCLFGAACFAGVRLTDANPALIVLALVVALCALEL